VKFYLKVLPAYTIVEDFYYLEEMRSIAINNKNKVFDFYQSGSKNFFRSKQIFWTWHKDWLTFFDGQLLLDFGEAV
tara:strand:- start:2970 stop:3197 length:228 start_codon:yes stop_codon:yes gene_type:complete